MHLNRSRALLGALVVGVAFAKGLAVAADLPLLAVHHLEGHLMANLFETPDLKPPFVASLVSGGNTMLVHVRAWGDYEVLGSTIDDAVGEAFDKVAKALGLGYPGGPVISKLAAKGNPRAIHFPRAMMHSGDSAAASQGLSLSSSPARDTTNSAVKRVIPWASTLARTPCASWLRKYFRVRKLRSLLQSTRASQVSCSKARSAASRSCWKLFVSPPSRSTRAEMRDSKAKMLARR